MASKEAAELAVAVVTSITSATGTYVADGDGKASKVSGNLTKMLAAQIDIVAGLIQKGRVPTKTELVLIFMKNKAWVTDWIPNDDVQCLGSLASLGITLAGVSLTGPLGALAGAVSVLADFYSTTVDCRIHIQKASDALDDASLRAATTFSVGFWDWVAANGGMRPPM